ASVLEAAEFMAQRRLGAVCALDEARRLIGAFSERDLLNRVVVPRHAPSATKLGEVISELRAVTRCEETPHRALERMEQIGRRHSPAAMHRPAAAPVKSSRRQTHNSESKL